MTSNVANQFFDYAVNARASYSPDAMNSGRAPAVNGWTAAEVPRFFKTSPDFSAQMYTDGQGNFRFSMRGSEVSNYAGDFRTADAALMMGQWDPQLADGIRFVGEAIFQIKATPQGAKMSLDDIRAIMDGSGHSLGGAIYEAAASFWGLRGMNVDGPGVAKQIESPEFQAIKEEFRARGLSDLQDRYELQEGDFQARRYTVVGAAEAHAAGVNVYTSPPMDALLNDMNSTPSWAYALGAAEKYAWETVGSVAGHPMGAIFKLEGLGDVDTRLLQLERQRNVEAGLSANGHEVDTVQYEAARSGQGTVQVTTYKDPTTGAIMEVRLSGTQVGGEFVASGAQALVIGMDAAGRTVLIGAAAHEIAAAQLGPAGGKADASGIDPEAATISADGPWRDYDSVSIQNHADGTTSLTFQGENGQTAWVLPNGEGGRTVVLTNSSPSEGEPQTITYDLDADGKSVGQPRFYGQPVSETGGPLSPPSSAEPDAFQEALLDAFETPPLPRDGRGVVLGDAGDGIWTDGGPQLGGGLLAPSNPYSFDAYLQGAGAGLTSAQQAALAAALGDLNLGADQLGFVTLPGGGGTLMTNADGEVIGELHTDASGTTRLKTHRINPDGSVEPVDSHVLPSGQVVTAEQRQQEAQASQAAGAVGLMNSIIGLQSWDAMSDLQRAAALVSIYNTVDALSGSNSLPGNLGTAASVLGLLNALESGDAGAALYSGLYLVESLTSTAATATAAAAPGLVTDTLGGDFLPALGFVLALDSGNPVAIVSSGLSLLSSLSVLGPWGMVAGAVLTICSAIFGNDIPTSEGQARAQWDAQGQLQIVTERDEHNGGPTAHGWMSALATGLQDELAKDLDEHGHPRYALVPQLLPSIGFTHDPDGFNYEGSQGHMFLRWIDDNGITQTRYYDGAGNRSDGSGQTLAGDFMQHALHAIAPTWAVQTTLAHWQAGRGMHLPLDKASLPQESTDGMTQTLQVLTLAVPGFEAPRESLIDVDGDGYLEATQWVQANQAMLAIDVNGDGFIGADELVNLQGNQGDRVAFNSLAWLDANGDGRVDASDPAFSALRLWMDVNGDGISRNRQDGVVHDEARSLGLLGIQAIDFTTHPPRVVYAHERTEELTVQMLTADTLGVAYRLTEGGVLEITEQLDGSGVAVLAAVNTRQFDGQAGHVHGGQDDTGRAEPTELTIDAGDDRVHTTSANTTTRGRTRSQRSATRVGAGDERVQAGAAGAVLAGQAAAASPRPPSSVAPVHVPLSAATGSAGSATAVQQVTATLLRSAEPPLGAGLDLSALVGIAIGAGAVQWPTLVSAGVVPSAQTPWLAEPDAQAQHAASAESTTDGEGQGMAPIEWARPVSLSTPDAATGSVGSTAHEEPTGEGMLHNTGAVSAGEDALEMSQATESTFPFDPDLFPPTDIPPPHDPPPILLDYPQVEGESASATEDTGLRFSEASLLANDSTLNTPARAGEPMLRITSVFAPVHGSVALQVDAQGATQVLFIPEDHYHGPASFSYTVTDQYGLSRSTTVSMDVAAVNDAPLTQGELASGDEDHTLLFTAAGLLANDRDVDTPVDGDVLRITRVGAAEHGSVHLTPEGTVRFVPDANYNGPARFNYWVADRDATAIAAGVGHEVPATVNLTILPVNDLPLVQGEALDSDEDTVLEIDPALLLANDTDVDTAPTNDGNAEPAQVLTITAVGPAQHGSIQLLPDGRLRFQPERDYFGPAAFSYTVDDGHGGQVQGQVVVNLAPVNDAPVALADAFSSNEDEILTLAPTLLLANDADVDNPHSDLVIVAVDNATHGVVTLQADGAIRFVPEADYFGPAQFTYTVSDGVGGFTVGTASLSLAPVNDAPRLVGEQLSVDEDTQLSFTSAALLLNDADVDNPHEDLQITAVGDATHGDVRWVNGEIVFTPQLNFHGVASFGYTVDDGVGGVSQARVDITFEPVNDVPVANDELIWGKRDITYTLTPAALLANDTDVESPDTLRIAEVANAQHGSVTLNANGSVTFVPEAGHAGRGSFDYWVEDPEGARSKASAQIDFSRINQTPTATDDSFIGFEDIRFNISGAQLLANDTDDGDPALANLGLRVTAVANASNGTASLDAQGNVSFVPWSNFYGAASFRYQVTDPEGASTWAKAFLTVQSVNDAPIIEDIWYGRPIYGYRRVDVYDGEGAWYPTYQRVTDAGTAQAIFSSGEALYRGGTSGSYAAFSPTYYTNGQLRPIEFNTADATAEGWDTSDHPIDIPVDDPYRQNGGIVAYDPDGNSSAITFSIGSSPQHGHAWANTYISAAYQPGVSHTYAGGYWVSSTGAWQYYSHFGDPYSGSDPFTVRVTDGQGASTLVSIGANHVGTGLSPIVIDLHHDGIELIRPEDSNVFMDLNGDGQRERLGWAATGDAVLVLDANQDARVDFDHEVSFIDHLPGARTDLEGLAAHDSNGDGLITSADNRWTDFGLFQDRNANGVQDEGEFVSLDAAGLRSLSLTREGVPEMNQGSLVFGTSAVQWTDGSSTRAADVMFAAESLPSPQPLPLPENDLDARVAHMVLLFNQIAALPDPSESHGLTVFVPAEQTPPIDDWVAATTAAAIPAMWTA